jgi:hypothetical protein
MTDSQDSSENYKLQLEHRKALLEQSKLEHDFFFSKNASLNAYAMLAIKNIILVNGASIIALLSLAGQKSITRFC